MGASSFQSKVDAAWRLGGADAVLGLLDRDYALLPGGIWEAIHVVREKVEAELGPGRRREADEAALAFARLRAEYVPCVICARCAAPLWLVLLQHPRPPLLDVFTICGGCKDKPENRHLGAGGYQIR